MECERGIFVDLVDKQEGSEEWRKEGIGKGMRRMDRRKGRKKMNKKRDRALAELRAAVVKKIGEQCGEDILGVEKGSFLYGIGATKEAPGGYEDMWMGGLFQEMDG
jgi:hypothetical protein